MSPLEARRRSRRRGTALAIPAGAKVVNGIRFGQAADLYDGVGVNTRFAFTDLPFNDVTTTLARIGELGIRHIRDGHWGSWWDWRAQFHRRAFLALRNRNTNLPAPTATGDAGHPIFVLTATDLFAPSPTMTNQGPTHQRTLTDWFQVLDGGHQHYDGNANGSKFEVGSPIPDGTTSNPNATIPNPWNFNDPEIPWEVVSGLAGPNEPAEDNQDLAPALTNWMRAMKANKDARGGQPAFGGLPVVTEAGISTSVKRSQLPVVAPSIIHGGNQFPDMGDWSKGTGVVDCSDFHQYDGGAFRCLGSPFPGEVSQGDYTDLVGSHPYNGDYHQPPDASRMLPAYATEWGFISRGGDAAFPASYANPSLGPQVPAHSGYWPSPDDISGEYMIRTILLRYWLGIMRRSYLYTYADSFNNASFAEYNFGVVKSDHSRKASFYALKNFLRIVGFTEAPTANRQPIVYSITGFSPMSNTTNSMTTAYTFPNDPAPLGTKHEARADRLFDLCIQQSATTYLIFVWRQAYLWDREVGNQNPSGTAPNPQYGPLWQSLGNEAGGRMIPTTQNLTVHLPAGVASCSVCQPTSGITTQGPSDANPPGQTFTPLTITSNTVPLTMVGNTKVLKVVMS